jgi:hypothetical protein
MANIATVMTVFIPRVNIEYGIVNSSKMLKYMTQSYGKTYYVPTWGYDAHFSGCIYTQHGEKWGSVGPQYAWEEYGDFLEAIWVRCFADGYDYIYRLPELPRQQEFCHYGFDEIWVSGIKHMPSRVPGTKWRQLELAVWATSCQGSYLAGNDRCDLLHEYPRMRSPSTPVRARESTQLSNQKCQPISSWWPADKIPLQLTQIDPVVLASATKVEFSWRGRLTRVYQRQDDHWLMWCLDHWDNCLDLGWLAEDPARLSHGGVYPIM